MESNEILGNPFALMMNPAEVFAAVERSDRLERLHRRICRPLDKPVIARKDGMGDYDNAIDSESEAD